MPDLQVRHAPALVAHITRHYAKSFRLDLAAARADERVRAAVEEGREDEAVAVDIGADEEHGAADGVQCDEVAFAAQAVEVDAAVVAPGVLVEGAATVPQDAVRL